MRLGFETTMSSSRRRNVVKPGRIDAILGHDRQGLRLNFGLAMHQRRSFTVASHASADGGGPRNRRGGGGTGADSSDHLSGSQGQSQGMYCNGMPSQSQGISLSQGTASQGGLQSQSEAWSSSQLSPDLLAPYGQGGGGVNGGTYGGGQPHANTGAGAGAGKQYASALAGDVRQGNASVAGTGVKRSSSEGTQDVTRASTINMGRRPFHQLARGRTHAASRSRGPVVEPSDGTAGSTFEILLSDQFRAQMMADLSELRIQMEAMREAITGQATDYQQNLAETQALRQSVNNMQKAVEAVGTTSLRTANLLETTIPRAFLSLETSLGAAEKQVSSAASAASTAISAATDRIETFSRQAKARESARVAKESEEHSARRLERNSERQDVADSVCSGKEPGTARAGGGRESEQGGFSRSRRASFENRCSGSGAIVCRSESRARSQQGEDWASLASLPDRWKGEMAGEYQRTCESARNGRDDGRRGHGGNGSSDVTVDEQPARHALGSVKRKAADGRRALYPLRSTSPKTASENSAEDNGMAQGRRKDSAQDVCDEAMMRDDGGNSTVTIDELRPEESLRFTHLLSAQPLEDPHSDSPPTSRPSSARGTLRQSSVPDTPRQGRQGVLTPFGGEAAAGDRLNSLKDNEYVPVSSPLSSTRNHQSTVNLHSKTTKTGRPLGYSGSAAPDDKDTVHTRNPPSEASHATTLTPKWPAHVSTTSRRDYAGLCPQSTSRPATATAHDHPINRQYLSWSADHLTSANEKEGESSQALPMASASRGGPREKSERGRHPNKAATGVADRRATSTSGASDRVGDATSPGDRHGARNNDTLGSATVRSPPSVAPSAKLKVARARDAQRTSRPTPSAMCGSSRSMARSAAQSVTPRTRDSARRRSATIAARAPPLAGESGARRSGSAARAVPSEGISSKGNNSALDARGSTAGSGNQQPVIPAIKANRMHGGGKAATRVEETASREGDSFGGAEGLTVEAYMARKRKAKRSNRKANSVRANPPGTTQQTPATSSKPKRAASAAARRKIYDQSISSPRPKPSGTGIESVLRRGCKRSWHSDAASGPEGGWLTGGGSWW